MNEALLKRAVEALETIALCFMDGDNKSKNRKPLVPDEKRKRFPKNSGKTANKADILYHIPLEAFQDIVKEVMQENKLRGSLQLSSNEVMRKLREKFPDLPKTSLLIHGAMEKSYLPLNIKKISKFMYQRDV